MCIRAPTERSLASGGDPLKGDPLKTDGATFVVSPRARQLIVLLQVAARENLPTHSALGLTI